jgi:putative spermidine/putrescine transport system substrate-binding protein
LKQQRPLIQKYWSLASDEIDLFKNGDAVVGASWPYQTITLQDDGAPVADLIPREGATGWADTWMLSSESRHPNCAYEWMRWISTPRVQAQQALYFGETPANTLACRYMDEIQRGSCAKYHANAPTSYFDSIHFWRTPTSDCGDGSDGCTDYNEWQQKWTEVKG